jgi:pyruvate/2-oxoacid:ferredoxin oxidoreductase alpha subunit
MPQRWTTIDGNEPSAEIAFQSSDVIAICPITPSSSIANQRTHMGSGAATVRPTVARLGAAARVGVPTVKLYRPFSVADVAAALPSTVRVIAVLDRTKEPGAIGEIPRRVALYRELATPQTDAMPVRVK